MGDTLKAASVDTSKLTLENERLENSYQDLKDEQEVIADSKSSIADGAKNIIKGFAAVGTAVQSLKVVYDKLRECTQASIEFESAVTEVYKTVDGTGLQLAGIREEIKQLSTVIPMTTTEIAAVAEAARQLGIETKDVMSFTKVMADLGVTTNPSGHSYRCSGMWA